MRFGFEKKGGESRWQMKGYWGKEILLRRFYSKWMVSGKRILEPRKDLSSLAEKICRFQSEAEVARYLGVTNSCVTRAVSSGQMLLNLGAPYPHNFTMAAGGGN